MREITFPTAANKSNTTLKLFKIARVLVIISVPVAVYLFLRNWPIEKTGTFVLYGLWFALAIFFMLSPFFLHRIKALRTFNLPGVVSFNRVGITIGDTTYSYWDINDLQFEYNGYNGESMPNKGNPAGISIGINKLSFTIRQETIDCPFFLEKVKDREDLEYILAHLYNRGIKVKEENNKGKTYLLMNLTDKQEKEFRYVYLPE